jgi:L-ascorbate metabolism protein UlaG (beta-lactamase superfamily)
MNIRWYGQSAFLIGDRVFVDPFGDMSAAAARGMQFDYPAIEDVTAELLLVTHEHADHNGVDAIGGEPRVIRSTAGTFDGILAIASEHDDAAGTKRGPNTIFRFELDGTSFCHFGDFGQAALRPEQRDAIGDVDVLFLPVGGGPTVGGERAAAIVREHAPRLVVPMHYRTERLNFLDPPNAFLDALGWTVTQADSAGIDSDGEGVALPAVP